MENSIQKKIPVKHKATMKKNIWFWIVAICLVLISCYFIKIDWNMFLRGIDKIPVIVSKLFSVNFGIFPKVLESMVITLSIAFIGVALSGIMAIFLAFFVASNTAPNKVAKTIIVNICILIRTIPITIWVLLAVASAGFGSNAAILGLCLPTTAYLTKAYANQIEICGSEIKETMVSLGTPWIVIIVRGFLPICKTSLLAVTAFRLEMSVSESTVLGLIGCNGIGFIISKYIKAYKFGELGLCLIVVLVTMFFLELGSNIIRNKMRCNINE